MPIEQAYQLAKQRYAAFGIDIKPPKLVLIYLM